MATEPPANPRFSFGKTVNDMFGVIGRRWLLLLGLAFLFTGVPNAIYAGFAFRTFGTMATSQAMIDGDWLRFFGISFIIGWLISFIFSVFTQAAMTSVALRDLRGQQANFGMALGDGVSHFLRVLGIVILMYIGIFVVVGLPMLLMFGAIGATATGSPGSAFGAVFSIFFLFLFVMLPLLVFMAVIWVAAIPAAIEERLGPISALGRSWNLSSGHRWKLAAMVVLFTFALLIVSSAISGVTMPFMPTGASTNPEDVFNNLLPLMVVQSFLGSVTLLFTHPAVAATYANLRAAKEGVAYDTVADVFE